MCGQQPVATVDHTRGEQTDVTEWGRTIFVLLNRERNVLRIKTPRQLVDGSLEDQPIAQP